MKAHRLHRRRAARGAAKVVTDNRNEADTGTSVVLAPTSQGELAPPAVSARAREYAKASRADATKRAYKRVWRDWCAWCSNHGAPPMPAAPEALASYLAELADAGSAVGSIAQTLSAINQAHAMGGHPGPRHHPLVQQTWEGIKRQHGSRPKRKATPLTPAQLRIMVATGAGLAGVRDRALLLLGFAAAMRRSELVALDVADLEFTEDGLVVHIRRSKTDQEGVGYKTGVPFGSDRVTCPVRALQDWLGVSGIDAGAVFQGVRRGGTLTGKRLGGRDVSRVAKRAAARVGVPVERLSGHSLRSGLATTAAKAQKPMHAIMKQGRWTSVSTVQGYIRDGSLLDDDNAAGGIGL